PWDGAAGAAPPPRRTREAEPPLDAPVDAATGLPGAHVRPRPHRGSPPTTNLIAANVLPAGHSTPAGSPCCGHGMRFPASASTWKNSVSARTTGGISPRLS